MASRVQHEAVGALLIQATDPVIAVAASPGDLRASAAALMNIWKGRESAGTWIRRPEKKVCFSF